MFLRECFFGVCACAYACGCLACVCALYVHCVSMCVCLVCVYCVCNVYVRVFQCVFCVHVYKRLCVYRACGYACVLGVNGHVPLACMFSVYVCV